MKAHLGEDGTEQFSVETLVDGKSIKIQPIHDPFIHNTTVVTIGRWDHFLSIFRPRQIKVQVVLRGSEGAIRAVMTLDPEELSRETEEILRQRQASRETFGTMGECAANG